MLQERQRLLLCLLNALDGEVSQTDFQKLLFLYTREFQSEPSYDFVPYKFGGFSFTSYADKGRLIDHGYLEADEAAWRLTAAGRARAKPDHPTAVALHKFCRTYSKLRGEALLKHVYARFSYYATRSEVAGQIIQDADTLARIRQSTPQKRTPGLLTIGYEGKTLETFLNQLLRESVTMLCDVRRNPISRKFGFSKSTLSSACEKIDIRYEHVPELGIASGERQELHTQADYDALFDEYERTQLPKQTAALSKLIGWLKEGHRMALTCFELDPQQCHRHCVAEALAARIGKSLTVRHLEEACPANAY
ncbi:MAG TPA: DUF488 family protein [Verrucomicrobiae bacterium]